MNPIMKKVQKVSVFFLYFDIFLFFTTSIITFFCLTKCVNIVLSFMFAIYLIGSFPSKSTILIVKLFVYEIIAQISYFR
jgi:hypothetical protein